jgi:ribosomal protein S18 acetylase RimI-like enzyme
VGVHPSFRRRGVATALAKFVIDQADADGVGCYLETYGDGTEALYRRLGFEVRDRWEVGPGAPLARTMWREPASTAADAT